jgi:hypothetical protein
MESRADIVMHTESTMGSGDAGASGVSGVVSSKSVTDLPLNGRSASDLAALEPMSSIAQTSLRPSVIETYLIPVATLSRTQA